MLCANTEGIFRIIQSIPSPKAEPFKRWLAKVGYERIQEIEDPELPPPLLKKGMVHIGAGRWMPRKSQIGEGVKWMDKKALCWKKTKKMLQKNCKFSYIDLKKYS